MAKSKVMYVDRKVWPRYSMLDKLELLWKKSGLKKAVQKDHRVIIKTHFGNYGNLMALRPALLRKMVDLVKTKEAMPILAESVGLGYGTGLYGGRSTAAEYERMAAANGFTYGSMGAPIIMLDGYWGTDTFDVPIKGTHLEKVAVGAALRDADIVIMFTHFKGHGGTGMGGALKNLGIGCVGKYSKAMMHAPSGPQVNPEECKGAECSQPCIRVCPTRCITVDPKIEIDMDRCIRCVHCASVCRRVAQADAISFNWGEGGAAERMIENALGVIRGIGKNRFYYINVALDISEVCDCMPIGPQAIVPDIGIFASRDPVAIDAACLEMVNKATPILTSTAGELKAGDDKFSATCPWPDRETGIRTPFFHHKTQLEYAEKLDLGTRKYTLKQVDEGKPPWGPK
jgi:uncharacterized Fe-S center protein